jgi:hypothetical protein
MQITYSYTGKLSLSHAVQISLKLALHDAEDYEVSCLKHAPDVGSISENSPLVQ